MRATCAVAPAFHVAATAVRTTFPSAHRPTTTQHRAGQSTFQSRYESERGGLGARSGGFFRSVENSFEEFCARLVQALRGLIIAHCVCLKVELFKGYVWLEELRGVVQ
jgi:hypothetical protein